MRCPRCGNENPGNNRFCGMCGATLLSSSPPAPVHPAPQPVSAPAAPTLNPAPAPASQPAPEAPRAVTRVEQEPASISGPSFLGLNDPAPPRKRGSLSIDPHSSTSSNLDYLLEDVEEPKGGGAGKVFLILLALLLAVGFGYLRFRTHGFPWASSGGSKPSPSAQPTDETGTGTPPASSPSISPEPQPAATQPAAPIQPAAAPVAAPAQTATQPAQPAPNSPSTTGSSNANSAPATSAPAAKASDTTPAAADANKPADKVASSGDGDTASDNDSAPTSAPAATDQPAADAPAPKPHAATRPIDTVAEAQRYIYGKGASQDCDRGLRLLKPSANQGNPKAMVEMGALYSAGLCTPRDLPTAYRWFALALRKDPSNESIQTDLQKLWGEMTQPERQLAIRLTQ